MKFNINWANALAGTCLLALSGAAAAEGTGLDLALPRTAGLYAPHPGYFGAQPYTLALNDVDAIQQKEHEANLAAETEAQKADSGEFKVPVFTRSTVHEYLGLGTLALVGLTALTAPDSEGNGNAHPKSGLHQTLGRTTAFMAAATVTTGMLAHWDEIHFADGITDPDNLHALLGTAGALAMLYAISQAPANGHASAGIGGGVAMAVAIKLTW